MALWWFVSKRMWSSGRPFVSLVVGLTLSVALVCGSVFYTNDSFQSMLRELIHQADAQSTAPSGTVWLQTQVGAEITSDQYRKMDTNIRQQTALQIGLPLKSLAVNILLTTATLQSDTPDTSFSGKSLIQMGLTAADGLQRHTTLVQGRWPQTPRLPLRSGGNETIEVAVETSARVPWHFLRQSTG